MIQELKDWPKLPEYKNKNQLVFSAIELKGNTQYGFRARCQVPDFNPVTSANSFFIEPTGSYSIRSS